MATTNKNRPQAAKAASKAEQKAEFLGELAERYAYWISVNEEYANAYEQVINAVTAAPKKD